MYHRALLWTMLGSLGVFAIADANPVVFVLGGAGIVLGWLRVVRGSRPIPDPVFNALALLVVMIAVLNALRDSFTVESFAFFSMLLLVLRLFDLRSPREHGQTLVLSLGFIIAAALTSNSLFTGIGVFVMTLFLTRTVLLFRLYAAARHGRERDARLDRRGVLDLRSIQLVVLFFCVLVSVVVFVVMPRDLGGSSLGSWGGAERVSRAGFSSDVELGRPGRITDSPTPVMRVTVRDRDDRVLGARDTPAVYLRGSVLRFYERGLWRMSPEESSGASFNSTPVERGETFLVVPGSDQPVWTREYKVELEPGADFSEGFLFSPWIPIEARIVSREARVRIDPQTRMIRVKDDPPGVYTVRVRPTRLGSIGYPEGSAREPVDRGVVPERIAALAARVLGDAGIETDPASRPLEEDPRAMRELEAYLRAEYGYTLDSAPVPGGEDPTEWFLFDRRAGHCEYYASSLALMARSVGIPSRVVTGYVVAEFNEVTGVYVVRQSNAHAWVEARLAPGTWRTYDGTPESDFRRIHEPAPSRFAALRSVYEAVRHAWASIVVGYDGESRAEVIGDLDTDLGLGALSDRFVGRLAAGRGRLVRAALMWGVGVFVITLAGGLAIVFLIRTGLGRAWLVRLVRIVRRLVSDRGEDEAARLRERIDAWFERAGAPRPAHRPISTHLDRIDPAALPGTVEGADALREASDVLDRFRFGPRDAGDGAPDWSRALASAGQRLRAARGD